MKKANDFSGEVFAKKQHQHSGALRRVDGGHFGAQRIGHHDAARGVVVVSHENVSSNLFALDQLGGRLDQALEHACHAGGVFRDDHADQCHFIVIRIRCVEQIRRDGLFLRLQARHAGLDLLEGFALFDFDGLAFFLGRRSGLRLATRLFLS